MSPRSCSSDAAACKFGILGTMTKTEGNYPSPKNPELVPCECHRCNNLYRVVCTGYGEPASAFCVKCGSNLEQISPGAAEWINSSFRDAEALTPDGVKPPATERAPTLTMPRILLIGSLVA